MVQALHLQVHLAGIFLKPADHELASPISGCEGGSHRDLVFRCGLTVARNTAVQRDPLRRIDRFPGTVTPTEYQQDRNRINAHNSINTHHAPPIPNSSISKISVAPPGISGGAPRSPYPMLAGHTSCDLPPTFIFCTPSVQHGITWFSGNEAGSLRLYELSNSVPLIKVPR